MIREELKKSWDKLTLPEQMGNIGSEVGRAARTQGQDDERFKFAVDRAVELFDLTLSDPRWVGRLREIGLAKELFCHSTYGMDKFKTSLFDLERYFMQFALLAQLRRSKATS